MTDRKTPAYVVKEMPTRLDVTNAHDFHEMIERHLQENTSMLVLDFAHCTFIDSSGLALLIHSASLASSSQHGMRLIHMNKHSRELIRISQLDRHLPVFDNLEQALEA